MNGNMAPIHRLCIGVSQQTNTQCPWSNLFCIYEGIDFQFFCLWIPCKRNGQHWGIFFEGTSKSVFQHFFSICVFVYNFGSGNSELVIIIAYNPQSPVLLPTSNWHLQLSYVMEYLGCQGGVVERGLGCQSCWWRIESQLSNKQKSLKHAFNPIIAGSFGSRPKLGGPVYYNNVVGTLKIYFCPSRIGQVLRLSGAVSPDVPLCIPLEYTDSSKKWCSIAKMQS